MIINVVARDAKRWTENWTGSPGTVYTRDTPGADEVYEVVWAHLRDGCLVYRLAGWPEGKHRAVPLTRLYSVDFDTTQPEAGA